jgi:acid phosphatase family membrane protein YuiD
MLDIFSIDLTQNEIVFVRQALDLVTVSGKDAKFLANLQVKIEQELLDIEAQKRKEEERKQVELQQIVQHEQTKSVGKKNS